MEDNAFRMNCNIKNVAVIIAGGVGSRMNSNDIPKQFLKLYGKPIIVYTLEIFEKCSEIDGIVVACLEDWIDYLECIVKEYKITKVKKIVKGGETGQVSIYNGLIGVDNTYKGEETIVLIHDSVRPLIDCELIKSNLECVRKHGSAITVSKVRETVVVCDELGDYITYIPNRILAKNAKAPQCFYLKDLLEVHNLAKRDNINSFVDSCSLMGYYGRKLFIVESDEDNIKITTKNDYIIMRALMQSKEDNQFV